jgi:hypothetical protein
VSGTDERRFTLEEANALLPDLRATIEAMRAARDVVMRTSEHVRGRVAGNGGGSESNEHSDAIALLKRETERLSREGIILRDIESGLIDFPAERDGQHMFLCWQYGEDAVGFWHPLDTGFGSRKPL